MGRGRGLEGKEIILHMFIHIILILCIWGYREKKRKM